MVAVPSAMPLTSPVLSTAATAPLLVVHVTARPERGLPLASFTVATSRAVAPTYTLAGLGLTVTEATGRFATLTFFLPFFPSLVAVIVADPTPTPLTRPLSDTVATALLLDRKSTRLNSSHGYISYAVFCLKKKKNRIISLPFDT